MSGVYNIISANCHFRDSTRVPRTPLFAWAPSVGPVGRFGCSAASGIKRGPSGPKRIGGVRVAGAGMLAKSHVSAPRAEYGGGGQNPGEAEDRRGSGGCKKK